MTNQTVKAAQEVVQKSEELDIRRSPISVAAAVIYMVTQLSDDRKLLSCYLHVVLLSADVRRPFGPTGAKRNCPSEVLMSVVALKLLLPQFSSKFHQNQRESLQW
ncbi:hypothetical protein ACHQM5_012632 [Ranunculus cassubicifolius]